MADGPGAEQHPPGSGGSSGGSSGGGQSGNSKSDVGRMIERARRRTQQRRAQEQADRGRGGTGPEGPDGAGRSSAEQLQDKAEKAKALADDAQKAVRALNGDAKAMADLARKYKKTAAAVVILSNPVVLVGLGIMLLVGLVLVTVVVLGGGGGIPLHGEVPDTEIQQELADIYRDAVIEAGVAPEVPWTVVAGIARVQTEHGRWSPYDAIDRAPERTEDAAQVTVGVDESSLYGVPDVGTYPEVIPAIGGEPDQGAGPFLLSPVALAGPEVGDDFNPQQVADSAELVAAHLGRIHDEMLDAGWYLDTDDPATHDAFWAEAVNRLGPLLADRSTGAAQTGCAVPSDLQAVLGADNVIESFGVDLTDSTERLAEVVDAVWRCEHTRLVNDGHELAVVTGVEVVQDPDGQPQVTPRAVTGRAALDLLVGEAMTVAQAHTEAVKAANGGEFVCTGSTGPGWFPLAAAAEGRAGYDAPIDHCDPLANVRLAAELVLGANTTPVAARAIDTDRPWAVMQDGWHHVPWALGRSGGASATDPMARFAESGPYGTWQPGTECAEAMREMMYAVVSDEEIRTSLTDAGSLVNAGEHTSVLANATLLAIEATGNQDLRMNPVCADSNGQPPRPAGFHDQLSQQAELRRAELLEGGSTADQLTTIQTELAVDLFIQGLAAIAGDVQPYVPGETSALRRLNPDRSAVAATPQVARGAVGSSSPNSLGLQVVPYAIWYGGLFPGDERGGEEYAVSFTSGLTGGFPLVVETDPKWGSDEYLYPHPTTGDAVWLECGSSGQNHYARPEAARLWEKMCNDALVDGVQLVVSSSTRSYEQQAYLKQTKGGLAASPGSSRHERGAAIDVGELHPVSSGGGVTMQLDGARSWMHTIVGCYDPTAISYQPLAEAVGHYAYADAARAGEPACGELLPIKRLQTYGLMAALCTVGGYDLSDPVAIDCKLNTGAGHPRENWHIQPGIPLALSANPAIVSRCTGEILQAGFDSSDRQAIAQTVYSYFYCEAQTAGWEQRPSDYAPFTNLADQVAAEAVAIAYCESTLDASAENVNNDADRTSDGLPSTDWGLFQLNDDGTLQGAGVERGELVLDPVANLETAWSVRLNRRPRTHPQGTWQPWACAAPDKVGTQDGLYSYTRAPSVDLPVWAVDPFTHAPS